MSRQLTRGEFLKAGLAAGIGVVAVGSLAACNDTSSSTGDSAADVSWDKEADVVVVGSGTVAYAALVAKDAGAESVVIVEKGERWGGTSAVSGTALWIPLSYPGVEAGSEDTREDAVTYMTKCAAGRGDQTTIEAYVDTANEFLEWSRDLMGWEWTCGTADSGGFRDYFEPYEGYRLVGRSVSLAEGSMWSDIEEKCQELEVEIMMETAATSLVTDDSGAVVGVVIDDGTTIKANTCVVLGTGGFDHNKRMIDAYQAIPVVVTNAVETNTGDGHLMGQAIGADLGMMDTNWGLPSFTDHAPDISEPPIYDFLTNDWGFYRGTAGAIVVNKYGKRIADESSAYAVFNRVFANYDTKELELINVPAYWIADSDYAAYATLPGQQEIGGELPPFIVQADTLDELASQLGIDAEGLKAEVEAFNANAVKGEDPVFGRGTKETNISISKFRSEGRDLANPVLAPVATAPFYGAIYVPGTCGTNGGLRINEFAQVLDTAGEPIPGLLAVGNCTASFTGGAYCGAGMTLGAGAVMSYIGVRHAMGVS